MKSTASCMAAALCLLGFCGLQAYSQAVRPPAGSASKPTARRDLSDSLARQPAYTLRIRGALVNKDGSPSKGQVVIAYPLDGEGTAISINTLDDKGHMVLWNPKTECDAQGRFTISMPRVASIGPDAIAEIALGLDEPPGGIVTGIVVGIKYADPNKKEQFGFVRKPDGLSLLRREKDLVRVKMDEKSAEVELGKIVLSQ